MLIVGGIRLDLGYRQWRALTVEPPAGDEVADHPTTAFSIVVEVHQAVPTTFGQMSTMP
jgi:hypothetical protein